MTTDAEQPFGHLVTSVDQLRALYRRPSRVAATKKVPALEPWMRVIVDAAPFVVLATGAASGPVTLSPKGGAPGFVRVLDDRHLALPDYAGNNLIDSLQHLVESPYLALLFIVPGRGETIRIDGRGWITTDPELLELTRESRRVPKTVIGIEIDQVFFHCPSAFNRAKLWQAETWPYPEGADFDDLVRAALPADQLPDWARPASPAD
jgi:PPOX class probable FMN-dependent enzyme